MRLYFRELGQGQPLIILHGLFGSSDNWLTISKEFAKYFHVFIVDQRNHGQSPHMAPHNYDALAADLAEFMEQQNIVNPYIIGHSMGGKTVMKFLTSHLADVKKAVVVDISPRYYPQHHQAYIAAMTGLDLASLQSRQEVENAFIAHGVTNIAERQFLMKNLYRDDNGAFHWKINLELLVKEIENIGEGTSVSVQSSVPTLFIKGSKSDYYIKPEDTELISQIFPNSKIITIENSGHWVQAEQPQAFFDEVMKFFSLP